MRNFVIGLIIGMVLGGVAYAATIKFILIDTSGDPVGTSGNPIYITGV